MSFIAVAAAGLAAVSAGSSLYNQYKQGKTLADTDWSGMAGDVMDSYRDNLSNLKDSADVVFDKIEEGWEQGVKGMGDKATTLWDQAQGTTAGFANFGMKTYQSISEKFNIIFDLITYVTTRCKIIGSCTTFSGNGNVA